MMRRRCSKSAECAESTLPRPTQLGAPIHSEAVRARALQGEFCSPRAPPAPAGGRCIQGVPGRERASSPPL
eukprot:scaffold18195_cov33-Phaeocystis_antarctica.AAC.2